MNAPPQSATKFWSIERVVAFILGPVVIAGAGWLSTFLAKEIGMPVSSETIVGVFGVGALGAAGLAYKWLHGRQLEMSLTQANEALISGALGSSVGEGFVHTTLRDLEGLAQSSAHHAVSAILQAKAGLSGPVAQAGEPPPAAAAPVSAAATADTGAALTS